MKVKVINKSSIETRDKIKKAFAYLLKVNKDLDKITVSALSAKAGITRGTFYTHYENIYAVAKDIQDETFEIFKKSTTNITSLNNLDAYFDKVFAYLKENEEIYSMILSSSDPLLFTYRLNKLTNKWLTNALNYQNIPNLELKISFFIDGCMSLVIKHFRGEINNTLDEINSIIKDTFKIFFNSPKN